MINQEEVEVKLGFNLASLKAGAEKAFAMVEDFAHKVRHSISHLGAELIAPLSSAGIAAGMEKALQTAVQIERVAAESGMSAESFQRTAFAFKSVGASAEDTEKWISKLAINIGEAREGSDKAQEKFSKWGISLKDSNGFAKDTTAVLDDISNKMKDIDDPTKKAAMAFDLFGKGATKAIAALQDGADALHQRGAGAAIFSEEDIANLKRTHEQLEQMSNTATIWSGKLISGFAGASAAFGKLFSGTNHKDRNAGEYFAEQAERNKATRAKIASQEAEEEIARLAKKDAAEKARQDLNMQRQSNLAKAKKIEDSVNAIEDSNAFKAGNAEFHIRNIKAEMLKLDKDSLLYSEKKIALAEEEKKAAEFNKLANKEAAEESKKELNLKKEIHDSQSRLKLERHRESNDELSSFMPTLEAMANSGHWDRRGASNRHWIESPFARTASQIQGLEKTIANDTLMGFGKTDVTKGNINRLNQLKDSLREAGVMSGDMKLEAVQKASEQTAAHLNILVNQAQGSGIKIDPVMK